MTTFVGAPDEIEGKIVALADALGLDVAHIEHVAAKQMLRSITWPFDEVSFEWSEDKLRIVTCVTFRGSVNGHPFAITDDLPDFPSAKLVGQLNLLRN